jgi:hypothetical protein
MALNPLQPLHPISTTSPYAKVPESLAYLRCKFSKLKSKKYEFGCSGRSGLKLTLELPSWGNGDSDLCMIQA